MPKKIWIITGFAIALLARALLTTDDQSVEQSTVSSLGTAKLLTSEPKTDLSTATSLKPDSIVAESSSIPATKTDSIQKPSTEFQPVVYREALDTLKETLRNHLDAARNGDIAAAVLVGKALQRCGISSAISEHPQSFCDGFDEAILSESIQFLRIAADAGDIEGAHALVESAAFHLPGFYDDFKNVETLNLDEHFRGLEAFEWEKVAVAKSLLEAGNVTGGTFLLSAFGYSEYIRNSDKADSLYDLDYQALKYSLITHEMLSEKSFLDEIILNYKRSLPLYAIEEAQAEASSFVKRLRDQSIPISK